MNKINFEKTKTVHVLLQDRAYDIHIGCALLEDAHYFKDLNSTYDRAVIVTNTTVAPLYLEQLISSLSHCYHKIDHIILPDGEEYKTWQSLDVIFTDLLKIGADRKTTLYALGGGVVGDITGFAAACYMRGIPFVQVPTTLLAQVDSSVGGKTAINHTLGKNMIGAFYQPQRVVADILTLKTLPQRELKAGLAELIKYGPIYDVDFFEWLVANLDSLLSLDPDALIYAIARSCQIKADIVLQDEREDNIRAILNFGHTFGHAIETGAGYGTWLHGEAVACGMVMAADLSFRLGLLPENDFNAIRNLITKIGLPTQAPALGIDTYLNLMQRDKKNSGGQIRYVLLDSMGHAVVQNVSEDLVRNVLHDYQV